MFRRLAPRVSYSRAERVSDATVHILGLIVAAVSVPVLVGLAWAWRGDLTSVLAVTLYGVCLLAMLGCSALYNIFSDGDWGPIYRRLDHSAIYLKIAGTYTSLIALTGPGALPLVAGLWTAALGGTSLKLWAPDRLRWLGLVLYLGMGWAGAVLGGDVIAALSPPALWLVLAGGILYTAGVAFFLWEALPFHITIWHGFVLVASLLLFAAMTVEVVRVA
ncbi:Hly-III family protein [Rhodobacteraceae bacterium CCMM004]|nr:Hly-III family protein [Rhodobacteraceae bacterium CCMM004]